MMSTCPAYLGLTIFDVGAAAAAAGGKAAAGETEVQRSTAPPLLMRSDLLIFCPSNFTLSVRLGAPPTGVASAVLSDAETRHSIVVRFADSASPPFDVRRTYVRSNATAENGPDPPETQAEAGARQRSSPTPWALQTGGDRDLDVPDGGNIILIVAVAGALFIAVYIGQSTAGATPNTPGMLLFTRGRDVPNSGSRV